MKIGFIVNPIAGMGGRLGLGGTDGAAYLKALEMGAKPWSPQRARRFLNALPRLDLDFLTCSGSMGENVLKETRYAYDIVYKAPVKTGPEDTAKAANTMMRRGAKLIIFVGGDGTARDVVKAVDKRIPILGVPAGVKMFSGVFAVSPEAAARLLREFLDERAELKEAEVLDIDEELYRKGTLSVRLFGYALTPTHGDYLQNTKSPSLRNGEEKLSIAKWFKDELYKNNEAYVFGPGSTTKSIMKMLGIETKNVLGVDLVYKGKLWSNLTSEHLEKTVDDLMSRGVTVKIVVSPTGGQGFLFGRGNMQITPRILKKVERSNIIVVATKSKILRLKRLYVDTGDDTVDRQLSGYIRVITGYNEETVIKVAYK